MQSPVRTRPFRTGTLFHVSPVPRPQQGRSGARLSRRALLMGGTAFVGSVLLGVGKGKALAARFTPGSQFQPHQSVALGTLLLTYREHQAAVPTVAWSPDNAYIASGAQYPDSTVKTWNALNGTTVYTYQKYAQESTLMSKSVQSLAWSPNSTRLVTCTQADSPESRAWAATDGGQEVTLAPPSTAVVTYMNQVAWSPDGTRIAIACGIIDQTTSNTTAGTVLLWDAASANALPYSTMQSIVACVAWSPDSQRIAFGSWDNTVQVWDVGAGSNVFTYQGHSDTVRSVAWSPDGTHIASASADQTVQVWDASNGTPLSVYSGHTNAVETVTWSPDSQRLASGGDDWTVQVWNAADGSNVYTYQGHADRVNQVAWAPDGTRIASASYDQTVQVWGAE